MGESNAVSNQADTFTDHQPYTLRLAYAALSDGRALL
jgi:hypothetical protein